MKRPALSLWLCGSASCNIGLPPAMASFEAALPAPEPDGACVAQNDSPTSIIRDDDAGREANYALVAGVVRQLFFLKGLTVDEVYRFVDAMVEERFEPDEVIFPQGAEGDRFYIIRAGSCAIELDGVGKVKEIPAGGAAPASFVVGRIDQTLGAVACFGIDAPTFDALVATCNARLVAPLKKLSGITLAPPDAHYALGAFLGDGQFAEVFSARPAEEDGAERAIKVVDLSRHDAGVSAGLVAEVEAMRRLRGHANVLNVYDCYLSGSKLSVVLDLCRGGDLFDRIVASGRLPERDARVATAQLLDAVAHCHALDVHRDLKPENILCLEAPGDPDEDVLKVGDFGLACALPPGEVLRVVAGTPQYAAPEVVNSTPDGPGYGHASDLYSLGMVLYVMLAGVLPETLEEDPADTLDGPDFDGCSVAARALVRDLVARDPAQRPTPAEALDSLWFSKLARSKSLRLASKDAWTSLCLDRQRTATKARWAAVRHAVLGVSTFKAPGALKVAATAPAAAARPPEPPSPSEPDTPELLRATPAEPDTPELLRATPAEPEVPRALPDVREAPEGKPPGSPAVVAFSLGTPTPLDTGSPLAGADVVEFELVP
ncbi:serine/threonine kinase [Aureococcus anophagefferens]|nr:serine/threonine kinase [Aureococcus anophagefferens]